MKATRIVFSTRRDLLALVLLLGACTSSGNAIGPGNELEVGNAPDTFQWQVTALSDITQTLEYTWVNSGTTANVNQSASLSSGSADLRLRDAAGVEVYSSSLDSNGSFQTAAGALGSWTVTVTLTNASGTLNFRLQKP